MTPEMQTVLMDLKDQMLNAIHQVDELLCEGVVVHHDDRSDDRDNLALPDDEDFDDEDPDDEEQEELVMDGVVDPGDASRKQKPIDYSGMRERTTAYKHAKTQGGA